MRRLLCLWVLFCLLMGITACSNSNRSSQDDVIFYYCRKDLTFHESDSVIACETRSKKAIGDDLGTVIHAYLSGPEDPNLTLLFPQNTTLTDIQIAEDTLHITISNNCANMNEVDLIRSCACLAQTLFPLTDATKIAIAAEDGFAQSDSPIVFTAESILTEDIVFQSD